MMKVIVVEDEELVRKGIVLTVDWESIDCLVVGEAPNGQSGLDLIEKHNPDLVVTDVKMPVLDGVQMIRELRERGSCRAEFIILTAHSDFSYAHSALKLGVADYLLKPFKDGQLEEAVKTIQQRLAKQQRQPEEIDEPLIRFDIEPGGKSKYVEQAIGYIRKHYGDPGIGIQSVAEHLGISDGHLSRTFKKETDYTFVNYLTHYRIRVAMNLLRDLRVKVYEVAAQVGYLDTTYFSTLFKRLTGISPSEYQDRYK